MFRTLTSLQCEKQFSIQFTKTAWTLIVLGRMEVHSALRKFVLVFDIHSILFTDETFLVPGFIGVRDSFQFYRRSLLFEIAEHSLRKLFKFSIEHKLIITRI